MRGGRRFATESRRIGGQERKAEFAEATLVPIIGLRTDKSLIYDVSEAGFAIYDQGEDDSPWGRFAVDSRSHAEQPRLSKAN